MKITIITAVFNGATTLKKTIQSVMTQSYQNIEYIVIDGASTDGSLEIAKGYSEDKYRVISERDRGFYDALNKGISMATGEVIGFLNADDIYANHDVITEVVNAFISEPELDCVYGDLNYVRSTGSEQTILRKWVSKQFTQQKLCFGWMPPHPTVFLKKQIYQKVGGFDLRYKISGDYDFILRSFGRKDFRVKYIPMLMINMQLGGISNQSLKNILLKMAEDYKILRRNGFSACLALILKNLSKIRQIF